MSWAARVLQWLYQRVKQLVAVKKVTLPCPTGLGKLECKYSTWGVKVVSTEYLSLRHNYP